MRPISAVNLIDIFLSAIPQNDAALPRRYRVAKPPLIRSRELVLVEAKKSDLNSGMGQCMAERVAAQRFNQAA
ncbi:MAG TPA: hypothetical protein IGS31_13460 [Oscillatoriales cyanobacterium M4454_W2019_049]|nr:hypothetical protein [Oscillatoriales cyanobacterium M4454_W2019_049]